MKNVILSLLVGFTAITIAAAQADKSISKSVAVVRAYFNYWLG